MKIQERRNGSMHQPDLDQMLLLTLVGCIVAGLLLIYLQDFHGHCSGPVRLNYLGLIYENWLVKRPLWLLPVQYLFRNQVHTKPFT